MVYVLFGPPGAGKGTQGARIAAQYGVPTISTGAIFRDNVAAGTPLGLVAKDYMSRGQLVPDEIVVQLVKDRISEPDCAGGFLLDGFPRTINQAEILEVMLNEAGVRIDGVLDFEVDEEELIRRLSGRRTCGKCGATYHIEAVPPRKAGICDQCGSELEQRADDMPEAIRTRLREYQAKTSPVLAFYRERGLLREINANATPDEIYARVEAILGPATVG
ncbi:MAG: adenylate kinase [Chthonomonadales bacterium]|nr:adenylate kinase [Chthonomonadales bacterium]